MHFEARGIRLFCPADFRDVVVLRQGIQMPVKLLHSLLVRFRCLFHDPLNLPLLLHFQKRLLGLCPVDLLDGFFLLLFI